MTSEKMNGNTHARPRAIALLSGGLDSTLAIKIVQAQNVDVVAVNFTSPFCTCSPRRAGTCHLASAVARKLGVKIRVFNKGLEYLRMVEHPRFGHGRGLNPCIDCRIFMLQKAAALMEEEKAQFIITGEVLGQRPMSQHRSALDLIERESGLAGRILRPLSAHWLPPTIPEQNGWVERTRLLAIRGRSRSGQLALAKREGVELFGCPSGGCLLTDPVVARRLRDLFRYVPQYDMCDVTLATFGRHFRLHPDLKVILGRNQAENDRLQQIGVKWPLLEIADIPGPMMLICGTMGDGAKQSLARLLRHFAPKATAETVTFQWTCGERRENWNVAGVAEDKELAGWSI
jgi:hypothetical protein